jgi:hypothetical protein
VGEREVTRQNILAAISLTIPEMLLATADELID